MKLRAQQLALGQLSLAWLSAQPFEKSQAIKLNTPLEWMFELSVPWEERDECCAWEVREQPAADMPKVKPSTSCQCQPGLGAVRTMPWSTSPPQRISLAPYRVQLLTILITQGTSFVFTNNTCKLKICKSFSRVQRHAVVSSYHCKCERKCTWNSGCGSR